MVTGEFLLRPESGVSPVTHVRLAEIPITAEDIMATRAMDTAPV